jgi:hypothetical protein
MKKISIISGYSGPGGSTEAFISLTNELNKRGFDAIFYGPNEYHLDKCKSGNLPQISTQAIVLLHYYNLGPTINAENIIYVSHELDWHPITASMKDTIQ